MPSKTDRVELKGLDSGHGPYLAVVVGVTVVAIAAIIGYNIWFIALPLGGPESWAQFGDYFGGILNPIIGLATVVLVLETLRITRTEAHRTRKQLLAQSAYLEAQLKLQEREAKLADMKRRLDGTLVSWEAFLDRANPNLPFRPGNLEMLPSQSSTLRLLLNEAIPQKLSELMESEQKLELSRDWYLQWADGARILGEMAVYCEEYDGLAGNTILADFYRRRVARAVLILSTIELIDPSISTPLLANPYVEHKIIGDVQVFSLLAKRQ